MYYYGPGLVQPLIMDVLPPWLLLSKHLPQKRTGNRCCTDPQTNGTTQKFNTSANYLSMSDVNEQFTARYQRAWTEEDVVELNRLFEKHLFASLENYTDPIPGVIPTLEKLACRQALK